MDKVRILPELLINKIAAGEVVERPASVVKELVENSVDSGADQILVNIKNGGKDYISVTDNGSGMSENDAQLAIERHATSKIKELEDLDQIQTMGFRGEALAAISSVSKFEIKTCEDETAGGFFIKLEGGRITHQGSTGFPKGTKITIEELFFNTPARQKFLKTINTEYSHIFDAVQRIALANPQVHFRLTHNNNIVFNVPRGQSFKDRVYHCLGEEFIDDLVEVKHEESYLSFHGMISKPSKSRPSRRWQYLYINNRYVKCPSVCHGIYEGYKTLLMKNMHPLFFMNIHLDPSEIDVNVHPAKTEVRVKNQTLIHGILADHVARQLKERTREEFLNKETNLEQHEDEIQELDEGFSNSMKEDINFKEETSNQLSFQTKAEKPSISSTPYKKVSTQQDSPNYASKAPKEELFSFEHKSFKTHLPKETVDQPIYSDENRKSQFQLVGQFKEYIIAEMEDRLVLLDKHAVHERIRFEQVRDQFYNKSMETFQLMIPIMMQLPPQDGIVLEQYQESWEKIGFRIDHFGRNDYSIKEIPAILKDKDVVKMIREILDEVAQFGKSGKMEVFFNEVFERMACHSAIRGVQHLSNEEMQSLLNQLSNLDLHLHCPHGRPVYVEFSSSEIEKRFKRIV